jgi:hypothetical protein
MRISSARRIDRGPRVAPLIVSRFHGIGGGMGGCSRTSSTPGRSRSCAASSPNIHRPASARVENSNFGLEKLAGR